MIGRPRAHYRVTDSTNERAKELALAGAPHGTLVTADEQTAGRGRQGRIWTAPPRSSILMSVVLRELDERHAMLPLTAAVAVCDALAPLPCQIKWPNDVWLGRRKLAGILVEGRPQAHWAVLGIGLNVNVRPEEFPDDLVHPAISVATAAGEERELEELLGELLRALDSWTAAPDREVLTAWRERDALKGTRVSWAGGEGIAAGIDEAGSLLVETNTGVVELGSGEVHLLTEP